MGHAGSMSPIVRQRYQANREALERYRNTARLSLWAIGIAFGAAIVVAAVELAPVSIVILSLLFLIGAPGGLVGFFHSIHKLDKVGTLPCEACGEDGRLGSNTVLASWVCGFCATTHPSISLIGTLTGTTLLDPCKNCHQHQHSVICRNCRQPIIWNETAYRKDTSAWYADSPPLEEKPPPPDTRPLLIDEDLV
jgi:hypothetical protein